MNDFLLLFIAIMLLILAVELSMVLYYAIIFMQNAIIIIKRVKELEGDFEEKLALIETELNAMSGKIIKSIVKSASRFFKK